MEVGIDKRGPAAVDVFEAFPDDGRFVEEDVVRDERVEGSVLYVFRGIGVGVGMHVRAGGFIHDGEVSVAKERDERSGSEGRHELEEPVIRQLGFRRVQKLLCDDG